MEGRRKKGKEGGNEGRKERTNEHSHTHTHTRTLGQQDIGCYGYLTGVPAGY